MAEISLEARDNYLSNPLFCADCSHLFPSSSQATRHACRTGHMADRYCELCLEIFQDKQSLGRHETKFHPRTNQSAQSLNSSSKEQQPKAPVAPQQQTPALDYKRPVPSNKALPTASPLVLPDVTATNSHQSVVLPIMPHRQERRKQQERGSPYAQSLTTAIIPTRQPTADLVGQTSNPDNQVNKIKGSKMPGKLIEDAPKQSKPLQFLPPPQYPAVQCTITSQVMWGDNNYSFFSQSENLFEALRLRRHGQDRLGRKNILTRENFDSWSEMRLPEGVEPEDFLCAPPPSNHPARQVVAMDCEMVGVFAGGPEERKERSELGQVCVVDVLNGEILMNKLVLPAERVMNWRKRFSGLSYPLMLQAGKEGRLLYGWEAAREELCNYINSDTIIIGHSLENDLHMLRLAHSNIVDTSVQTAEAVFGNKERFERIWKLKDLAKALPKITIQNSRQGHDCVEDTLATREVALWAICFPEQLEAWASQMRTDLEKKRIEREKKLKEQAEKKKEAEKENA